MTSHRNSKAMPSHFPTQPAELTASWLSQTLGYEIHDFDVQPFAEGAGIIGQVVRVQLDGRQPFGSLVAKFPSPSEANRAVAHTYDMYGREIGFYRTIANQVSIRTPKCYFADFDDSTQNFVLLMEDLRDFEIGDQVKGCSLENARQIISSIARLHASAWQPDHLNLVSHNNSAQRDGMIAGFNMGWPAIVNAFRDLIPDAAMRAGDKMASATPWLLQEMCAPPVCLAHADVRLDNVFFGAGEIALVDWQSVCTSAPEQDLAYFLTQSVPLESVLAHDLKGFYYQELRAHGIDYPRTTFERRYKVAALYLLNYAVIIAGTLDLGNERGQALARTLLGGSLASLDEMGAFDLL